MDCCELPSAAATARPVAATICSTCHRKARKVEPITVDRILKDGPRRALMNTQYHFCETPTCEVVYFSNETGQYFTKDDVRVPVGLKETRNPIPICYCFGHTVGSARDEIMCTGRSTVVDSITAEIEAGNCACEVKNPSGRCCLGEVSKVVKALLTETEVLGIVG